LKKYLQVAREASDIILRNLQRASDHIKGFKQVAVDRLKCAAHPRFDRK
jgi:hypothetical protein